MLEFGVRVSISIVPGIRKWIPGGNGVSVMCPAVSTGTRHDCFHILVDITPNYDIMCFAPHTSYKLSITPVHTSPHQSTPSTDGWASIFPNHFYTPISYPSDLSPIFHTSPHLSIPLDTHSFPLCIQHQNKGMPASQICQQG